MQIRRLVMGDLETNCYVVSDAAGQTMIIDPADDAEQLIAFLRQNHLCVVAVVLTHAHFDHMLAAHAVRDAYNVPLYIGQGDSDAMTNPIRNLSGLFSPDEAITIEDFTCVSDGDSIRVGELSFEILETPGHTPGCICLHCGGVLFSGDTLFADSIGRLDFPGGDPSAMQKSLLRLMQLPSETEVFPGHGPETTIGREAAHNPYLQ